MNIHEVLINTGPMNAVLMSEVVNCVRSAGWNVRALQGCPNMSTHSCMFLHAYIHTYVHSYIHRHTCRKIHTYAWACVFMWCIGMIDLNDMCTHRPGDLYSIWSSVPSVGVHFPQEFFGPHFTYEVCVYILNICVHMTWANVIYTSWHVRCYACKDTWRLYICLLCA